MTTTAYSLYNEFAILLQRENIVLRHSDALTTKVCQMGFIDAEQWLKVGSIAASIGCRWVATWASQVESAFQLNVSFEKMGQYVVLRTTVPEDSPNIHSLASIYPAADRLERHIHDLFGIVFDNHPNFIRWTRHNAWGEKNFPLRKEFAYVASDEKYTLPDTTYPFLEVEGSGVCEIPVGPVHAGIIEPGHFRFQVAGEDVMHLEERLGYVHKGIEKLAEGKDVHGLIRLAGRISGDSTVSHAWAACKACEDAAKVDVPERALFIRAIMAERERIANHLGDIGAICNDVGFAFAYYQFGRLRELWQRTSHDLFGHRFMMDCVLFGGVKKDLSNDALDRLRREVGLFKTETSELFSIIHNHTLLQDRLEKTGILPTEISNKLGAVGYVGRASGSVYDVRCHAAYAPYDQFTVRVPTARQGDVASRMRLRGEEIAESLKLLDALIEKLPATEIIAGENVTPVESEGLGLVEGWRGEILTYVSFNQKGEVSRFFARDPSWLNWPALEYLILENIVPDFPVCNKSVNASYSGHDL